MINHIWFTIADKTSEKDVFVLRDMVLRMYWDGEEAYPTLCSTGTEDYFGGAWSFADWDAEGKTYEKNYCMPMRGFYRWHLPDPVMFDEHIKVTIQQIGAGYRGLFERQDDVASVAYWYQTNHTKNIRSWLQKKIAGHDNKIKIAPGIFTFSLGKSL